MNNPKATIGEVYGPAMKITDPEEAKEYFEAVVVYSMEKFGTSREEAEHNTRSNLGFYAGYHDSETEKRVYKLFGAHNPIFNRK
jgi:hypothetical protein